MSIIPKTEKIQRQTSDESWLDHFAKATLFNKLDAIQTGFLQIYCNGMVHEFGSRFMSRNIYAKIHVHDVRAFRAIVLGGEPAAGRTYVQGWWSSEDLLQVLRLFTVNRQALFSFKYGLGSIARFFAFFEKASQKNNESGAKKNICAHYDIGNDLYHLFLDKNMMYSSAYFTPYHNDIERASEYKLKLICEKLKLSADDQVIEIGSGWGGFAIYAAENYGCHVTTTTISEKQFQFIEELIDQKNLSDRVTILRQDYRNLDGQYDKLVSIEMIESVGNQYIDKYFSVCNRLLKPNGIMLIQAITISDYLFKQYIQSMDFIRKYIFPGGSLPSVSKMVNSAAANSELTLFHSESFAASYAKTLACWYQRFIHNKEKVIELGYPQSFLRLWEYYLKYCQTGFEERVIDVQQLIFKKPDNRWDTIY